MGDGRMAGMVVYDPRKEGEDQFEGLTFDALEERGRLQYFFHCPASKLPVRDVLNRHRQGHKTEPHIEIGAENYQNRCYYPNNILPHLKSAEKYLFLFTMCEDPFHCYYKRKVIVGYIEKSGSVYSPPVRKRPDRYALKGDVRIYSFDDAIPIDEPPLNYSWYTRTHLVCEDDTRAILGRFSGRKDITEACVREIQRLDEQNPKMYKTCRVLRGQSCPFQKTECRRWNLPRKAMLLRVGIDKGNGGVLAPLFEDGSFEYIPIPETEESVEERTYETTIGRNGVPLSNYLPKRMSQIKLHFDPEFETLSYGDMPSKKAYLKKLNHGDLLVFYAGLTPYGHTGAQEGLYIIGYFTVDEVVDLSDLTPEERKVRVVRFSNNAHLKRTESDDETIIVTGKPGQSRLLDRAILISTPRKAKNDRMYHAVSEEIENRLGISGSIQRCMPPRFVEGKESFENLLRMLNL